jgi:hypothetical protein
VHFISLFKSDANARALPAIFLLLVRGAARLCEGGSLSSRATQAAREMYVIECTHGCFFNTFNLFWYIHDGGFQGCLLLP